MINKLGSLDVWESRPSNSGRRNVLLAISKRTLDWQNRTAERTNQPIPSSTHQPQKDRHYTPAPSARLNAQLTLALSFQELSLNQHTHTHPFNGPFSGTTQVSQYQKGKTNLDFTKARDSEWQWHPLGHMQVCTSLQTDNHTSTPPLSFLQARCPSCHPTNSVKALKANSEKSLFSANYTILVLLKPALL